MPAAPALFASDLHLTPDRPQGVARFHRFLTDIAAGAGALYLLGDVFEAWVGDDDLDAPFNAEIVTALRRLAERGVCVHFLPGNRDFLVGAAFATAGGLNLLDDPTRMDLFGVPTLLAHGDALCTDDVAYQAFRRQCRDPDWQRAALAKPLAERHALARAMRAQSERIKADNTPEIMDVNAEAVAGAFRAYDVRRLIHGHTHRPAHHSLEVDGRVRERWVLPAWYEGGGYLYCDDRGVCELKTLT